MIQRLVPLSSQLSAAPLGLGAHALGEAAEIGLGQPEAAHRLAGRHGGQPAVLLGVGAIGVERVHDQGALDRSEGAQARIPSLELLHGQAVGDVVQPGAAVALQVGAEETELAHLRHQLHGEGAVLADVLLDHGKELPGDELPDRVPRHPLLVGEELVEAQEVDTAEVGQGILRSKLEG